MNPEKQVSLIINGLKDAGHQVFVTGGAVRDMMLNRPAHDVDILTSASLDEVAALFKDRAVKIVGRTFPVCMVDGIEISSPRQEFGADDFPESDLAARDLTLNALAFDPVSKQILDPFNGRKDMENGVIRFTKDPEARITEDPVRMVRACRFVSLIEGSLSVSSLDAVIACRHLIENAAKERIRHEIMRAMQLDTPSLFFKTLRQTGLLRMILPSLDRCHDLDGGPFHGETVFEHCMQVGDALSKKQPLLRLAGFLHDVGKFDAADMKDGRLTFAGHDKQTRALVDDLKELRFSGSQVKHIEAVTLAHMRPLTDKTTNRAARRLLSMLDTYDLDYKDFLRIRIADKKGNLAKPSYNLKDIRIRLQKLKDVMNANPAVNQTHLNITGNDIIRILGIRPGPRVGEVKKILLDYILDYPDKNTMEELEKKCRSLKIKT